MKNDMSSLMIVSFLLAVVVIVICGSVEIALQIYHASDYDEIIATTTPPYPAGSLDPEFVKDLQFIRQLRNSRGQFPPVNYFDKNPPCAEENGVIVIDWSKAIRQRLIVKSGEATLIHFQGETGHCETRELTVVASE